jgi:hypothetical protein
MNEKLLASIEMNFFFRKASYTLFDQKRNEEILEELKIEPVDSELRRHNIKLATTFNKNDQQKCPKNNAEL